MTMIGVSLWAGIVWVGISPAGMWPLSFQAQHRIARWEEAREDAEQEQVRTLEEYRAYIESRPSLTPELKKLLIESEEFRVRRAERSEREHREFLEEMERDRKARMERRRDPPPKPTRTFK